MKRILTALAVLFVVFELINSLIAKEISSGYLVFAQTSSAEGLEDAEGLDKKSSELYSAGRYEEAIPYAKRLLEIREKALGKEHPAVARSLNNLAELYRTTGRYAEAEPLFKRSLEILEKTLGKEHPDVAANLHHLALLYYTTNRYAEAEPLLKRSLEIYEKYEKALGKEHSDVAASLNGLAVLYRATNRYAEAEPLFKRSLEINEKALGKEHPYVSLTLNNLAELYRATNRNAEAEPLFKRSLEINEKVLGKEHPDVALSLHNLAFLYDATNRHLDSHKMFAKGLSIDDKNRENIFLLLSEKQKLSYMQQKGGRIHAFISHTTDYMQENNAAVRDSFNTWLRWKGQVAESQGRYIEALYRSDNPEIQKKFEELDRIRREAGSLRLSKSEKLTSEDYKKRLKELDDKKGLLEVDLTRLSKDYALEKLAGEVDTKSLSDLLPNDAAYIDFANIQLYDFKKRTWGKSRYLAFVLLPGKEPVVRLLDIADTEDIDRYIKEYREEMNRPNYNRNQLPIEDNLKRNAAALYEIIVKPLEPYIKGKKKLYISPDGNLNLIPFEVLVTPAGKYLMEDYLIGYIGAGRDIIRFKDTTLAGSEALIIADPDYDMGAKEKEKAAKKLGIQAAQVRGAVSRDAKGIRSFERLPDTKDEADKIEKVLRKDYKLKVGNYQDKNALEELLYNKKAPKILHLATHGYFLKDEDFNPQQRTGLITGALERAPDMNMENPMLRSGVALAGVNKSIQEGRDDGMVSAEKILGLKLKGTELVVLSACETGVGDVKSGEGVFGLKRSFILSGAKTIVMSLWSVPSRETTELMTLFYTLMAEGKTKAEALNDARAAIKKKHPNPFYWGAFIMMGKPDKLE